MSEESSVKEAIEMAQEASKPGVFNLAEVIKGRGYPEREVNIYTDAAAAYKLVDLDEKMKALKGKKPEEYAKLEAEAQKVAEQLQKSKLTFLMRGVGQGIVEKVSEEADAKYGKVKTADENENAELWMREYISGLVAANIVQVTDADGNIDKHEFTTEEVLTIRNNIPAEAWGVLVATMQKLTLATGYFKGLTDAGFLPKS